MPAPRRDCSYVSLPPVRRGGPASPRVPDSTPPAARAAARARLFGGGISYYKTAAPPVIDFGATPTTPAERDWLRAFYLDGLGEFAYRNGIDLSGLTFEGPLAEPHAVEFEPAGGSPSCPRRRDRLDLTSRGGPPHHPHRPCSS